MKLIKINPLYYILILISFNSYADEGMWMINLLRQLEYSELQSMGLQLTPDQIYSVDSSSLKDAIIMFNGGCSGSIISAEGLLLTNHHCGFEYIRDRSTTENNYVRDGFWAQSRDEELPNPGLSVSFLRSIEDVTDKILQQLSDEMELSDRNKQIQKFIDDIEDEAIHDTYLKAKVKSFYGGNKYYLILYEEYHDIRLVGTPPTSIVKYGKDEENWMWPRHSCDFSLFRIYTAPDGSPANYSPDNIPYRSDYFLPISIKGIEENDYTMILGYPGSTDRFSSVYPAIETEDITNVIRIKVRQVRQDVLADFMDRDEELYLKYSSKYYKSRNYWKKAIGQNICIDKYEVIKQRKSRDEVIFDWSLQDSIWKLKYDDLSENLSSVWNSKRAYKIQFQYLDECIYRAVDLTYLAFKFRNLEQALRKADSKDELVAEQIDILKKYCKEFYEEYDKEVDKAVAKKIFRMYHEDIPLEQQPELFQKFKRDDGSDLSRFVDKLYAKSFLADEQKLLCFLDKPSHKKLMKDIGFYTSEQFYNHFLKLYAEYYPLKLKLNEANRLYIKAIAEAYPDSLFYPDANATMRFSYGRIKSYNLADTVHYNYFTTFSGMVDKYESKNGIYQMSEKLYNLFLNKDYKPYSDTNDLVVCFITTNDITGGSSGSPVLNGKGEMIGLAFDSNWEGLSGDLIYEKDYQRVICVDIRFVLFIIDKYAGANYLFKEIMLTNN